MRVQAVVDRFEGMKAVLLTGDEEIQVVWPRQMLPPNIQEGDILWVDLAIDVESTQQARIEADNLMRKLLEKDQ